MPQDANEKEAWEKFCTDTIYGTEVKPSYVFPTRGSHYAAFKAGWDAAIKLTGEKE
jgi:hypothetical protein